MHNNIEQPDLFDVGREKPEEINQIEKEPAYWRLLANGKNTEYICITGSNDQEKIRRAFIKARCFRKDASYSLQKLGPKSQISLEPTPGFKWFEKGNFSWDKNSFSVMTEILDENHKRWRASVV